MDRKIWPLKCDAHFFDAVESGEKPFEIRMRDGRDYKVGDEVVLMRVVPTTVFANPGMIEAPRTCRRTITFVLPLTEWAAFDRNVSLELAHFGRDVVVLGFGMGPIETTVARENQRAAQSELHNAPGKIVRLSSLENCVHDRKPGSCTACAFGRDEIVNAR